MSSQIYNSRSFTKIAYFLFFLLFCFFIFLAHNIDAKVLFSSDEAETPSPSFQIDSADTSTDSIDLKFGTTGPTISYDLVNSNFIFNAPVNLRVQNLSSAPTCDAGAMGKVYQNTLDGIMYSCNGTDWKALTNAEGSGNVAQTVIVAKSGGDFTSVKSAVDSITDSSTNKRYVVLIYPGTYSEAPMTVPAYTSLVGVSDFENTIIVASSSSAPLIIAGHDTIVKNLGLNGFSNSTCLKVVDNSYVSDMEFKTCQEVFWVTGSSARLQARTVYVHSGTFVDAIKIDSGATADISNFHFYGGATATNGINLTGDGSSITIDNSEISGSGLTNGIYLNNNVSAELPRVIFENATYGIHTGPDGIVDLKGASGCVHNSGTYDLYIESGATTAFLPSWHLNTEKLQIPEAASVIITYADSTTGNESFNVLGKLQVGNPENPYESTFGEGDSYSHGMMVYTYNGSTYTDVSSAAADSLAFTFTFPGVSANNAIYISTDRTSAGSYDKFPGYKILMGSTPLSPGSGEIVHEYWNGSSWVEFGTMCTNGTLFYAYSKKCFLRASTTEHVRFDNSILSGWVANDPVSSGTNRYWIRVRIKTAITTAPVFEQFEIHTNNLAISYDGTLSNFGSARYRRSFIVSPETIFYGRGTNAPTNASFNIGTGGVSWVDERAIASFTGGGSTIEEISGAITIPKGIDTSNPLKAKIYWKKSDSNTGNVQWKIDYLATGAKNVPIVSGSSVVPAARSTGESITGTSGTTIVTSPTGSSSSSNEIILSDFAPDIDISKWYEGDTVFLRLYRDPTDFDDTYSGNAIIVGFELSGVFWTQGERLFQ